ncbi:MAG: ABC transporter related protein [Candidatus Moranbacteria bacterium GW2011_GWC2_37_8]|nr:MAG: ABC transporter related protein [Candidatus Moranbacteria bacterium GW2011_GWC2_37_8]KKQ62798.1 MAG: ABC transporter, transmembrane region:ABC transporter related protein [Parcubacteria group bacterium GW2011_GWC1_38_22]KKQ81290.1 MAG: ABC transporter related protein [Candidatus Moranbacteria bacterium GW2011_GWD2_38_7]
MIKEEKNKTDLIEYSNLALIKDIGKFLKPYKGRFLVALIFRVLSDVAGLYLAYGFALIVTFFSKYHPGESLRYFWVTLLILTAAFAARYIFRYISKYVGYRVSEKVALDSQIIMIEHLTSLDIAWHEKENAGNKLKRIQKGSDGLNKILHMLISTFMWVAVNFIGMIYILSRFDKKVGVMLIIFLISYFVISFYLLKKAVAVSQEVDIMEEGVLGLMFQTINNIRSVKVLAMSDNILKIINVKIVNLFSNVQRRIFRFMSRAVMLNIWSVLFRIFIMILIANGIFNGNYEVGVLVLFYGYFNTLVDSVEELSEATQEFTVCKYGVARMQRTLEEPIVIDSEKNKHSLPVDWKKIIVKNLSFAYGKNKVLKNISFEINRGERVGIVGLSGAGKSTLMKLLLKENESYKGEILFDELPLRKIKTKSFLNHVGVVLQDTEVFNFTLRENITIASSKKRSEQELMKALDIAHVTDFAKELPQGIDTFIGEKGIKLSGGERQRLGIARAVYKQPEILFLDEATSHLDLESEEKIKDSLHKFLKKVTAVVIAHRLTTIREMDKILVIEKGEIIESGSFDELYNAKGRLYELWEKQKF